ncbi:insulinoma-associated protein 1a [Scyliorhinus torazame]|uniref:insulinoma-associated protein 1a n=1 Tax=Scyliorhinus torazame TaxID=75743 RepID=UPI003B59A02A
MPRGFLVKRNNKSSPVSYRIRSEDEECPLLEIHPLGAGVRAVGCPDSVSQPSSQRNSPEPLNEGFTLTKSLDSARRLVFLPEDGAPAGFYAKNPFTKYGIPDWVGDSCTSTTSTTDIKVENAFLGSCLESSAPVDSFAAVASLKAVERFLVQAPYSPAAGAVTQLHDPGPRHRRHKPTQKPKVIRKLNFQDEVSTSPVLGLTIKVDARDYKPSANKLLAEFICQLCKERYSDSFSLAQHKCSRIVRVEYRCPECNKVFSCPANLASHRRWHRPRPGGNGPKSGKERQRCPGESARADPESKESSKRLISGGQSSSDSVASPEGTGSPQGTAAPGQSPAALGKVEPFGCPDCSKRFRRQAYLKKHLVAHQASLPTFPNRLELSRIAFPCQLCHLYLASAESHNKHVVERGDRALLSPGCGDKCGAPTPREDDEACDLEGQLFSCKHCPSTFFSSPGLTRHINKWHPSENRQVLLLQLPIRPGC